MYIIVKYVIEYFYSRAAARNTLYAFTSCSIAFICFITNDQYLYLCIHIFFCKEWMCFIFYITSTIPNLRAHQ